MSFFSLFYFQLSSLFPIQTINNKNVGVISTSVNAWHRATSCHSATAFSKDEVTTYVHCLPLDKVRRQRVRSLWAASEVVTVTWRRRQRQMKYHRKEEDPEGPRKSPLIGRWRLGCLLNRKHGACNVSSTCLQDSSGLKWWSYSLEVASFI